MSDQEKTCPSCKHFIYCENTTHYAHTKAKCDEFEPDERNKNGKRKDN